MDKTHVEVIDHKPDSKDARKGSTRRQWFMAILVNITLIGNGLQNGWIACSAKILQSEESPLGAPLSAFDISWLASSPSLTAVASIPVFMFAVDRVGRKACIIVCAVLYLVSSILMVAYNSMTGLLLARLLGGVAGGGCMFTVPMYVKEISQDDIRGTLGMVNNLARNSGVLIMYIMGACMDYYAILWSVLAISVANTATIFLAPESPTYYVKIGNMDAAVATVAYLRDLTTEDKPVQNAINAVKSEDERFKSIPDVNFFGIFKQKAWRNGFIFMILVMFAHGLNGGFSIVNYAPSILVQSGVTVSPELQSLSVPVTMLISSLVSLSIIEKLGRKLILMTAFLLAMLSFSALAAIIMIQNEGGYVPGWITVVVLLIPVYTYAAAVSPIPYVIMAEMFNFQIRAKVMACLSMLGWFNSFIQTLAFGPITAEYGAHVTFICAAIVNLCGTAIVLVLLPETKAKSVEQIELELEKRLECKHK